MDVARVVEQFESEDPHQIWQATWEILRCNDLQALSLLEPMIPHFQSLLAQVELGGMVRNNAKDSQLALRYIQDRGNGLCRCTLYSGQNFFNPVKEAELGIIHIDDSQLMKQLHEQHFRVRCAGCDKAFNVREVGGWHVPWYEWSEATNS